MITPGGEVAFVRKMFMESLELKDRCRCASSTIVRFLHTYLLFQVVHLAPGKTLICVEHFDHFARA